MFPFLVEDGTGLSEATSYVEVAFSDTYLGATWAADSEAKEAALMAATEYFDLRWGRKLKGRPILSSQALELPRVGLRDNYGNPVEGIPNDVKKAVCLYAQEQVQGTLYPSPVSGNSKEPRRKRTTVGPITTEIEYEGQATLSSFLKFPRADRMVVPYTTSYTGVIR